MFRKLTENRIELLELLKDISTLASEIKDPRLKAKIADVLNKAFLVCLDNAELMSDSRVIQAFHEAELAMDQKSPEKKELEQQAQSFQDFAEAVSSDYLVKWADQSNFKA